MQTKMEVHARQNLDNHKLARYMLGWMAKEVNKGANIAMHELVRSQFEVVRVYLLNNQS
jgi:hypothetical protein